MAVEAARAGAQGKGFAIVAQEVRKLAERSKKAAEDIEQLSMLSKRVTLRADEAIGKVVPEIDSTAQSVKTITENGLQQSSNVKNLEISMNELNDVIQQNASASEELATSAEELSAQSSNFLQLVAYFKV